MLVKVATALFIGAILVGAVVMSNDVPGGPVHELVGVVKGTAVQPRDTGPSPQIATVVLAGGIEVQATVNPAVFVRPGHAVRVHERRGIISGRKTYEIFAAREAK